MRPGKSINIVNSLVLRQEIKDSLGKQRIGASAMLKLNRKDFGINYNKVLETGGVIVGDEVSITLDVQLVRN